MEKKEKKEQPPLGPWDVIHVFDPVIYSTRLYVISYHALQKTMSNDDVLALLNEAFWLELGGDDGDASVELCSWASSQLPRPWSLASTIPVSSKKDGWHGCLVLLNRKNLPLDVIAHEAVHCSDWLFSRLGISHSSFLDGEPYAYYLQWVVRCILEVCGGKGRCCLPL